ncbi:MAG: Gfo/Idh/MocA family oxidoreductase [Clostridia bacterium]|nr:Gfo/Idh/MocA family oxidoreductase [Clostridia bacterium]
MKRVCIVGCGAISGNHAEALQKTENASLVAVCDINHERADKLAEKYNIEKVYYDYAEVLEDTGIDAVHICTPHYLHTDMAISALEKGKFVFLEKPVSISNEQLDRLKETEQKHPGKLAVCFQNRTNPSVVALKEALTSEENGAFLGIKAFLVWHRTKEYYAMDAWRGKWDTEGGGLMINQAVHTLDLLSWLSGGAKSVKGTMSTKVLADCIEVEDTAEAIIFLNNGHRGCFYGTNAYSTDSSYNLEVDFENVTFRYADNFLYKIEKGKRPEIVADDSMDVVGKSYWGNGHSRLISAFYENGNEGMSLSEAEPTFRLLFAFYESASKNGEEVEL